jgi:hypothetical protein
MSVALKSRVPMFCSCHDDRLDLAFLHLDIWTLAWPEFMNIFASATVIPHTSYRCSVSLTPFVHGGLCFFLRNATRLTTCDLDARGYPICIYACMLIPSLPDSNRSSLSATPPKAASRNVNASKPLAQLHNQSILLPIDQLVHARLVLYCIFFVSGLGEYEVIDPGWTFPQNKSFSSLSRESLRFSEI